ncbi:MAG: ribosomal protein S18-alanine N-acetyltransferase [Thermomicrobiales bacterium]|nr:ribosomal protein S18-alanine N-acetyltransferase [Thermomicrobiales bacterium]
MYFIEAMTESDVPEVSRLERRCFTNPWPQSAYRRELRKPHQNCYLVLRGSSADDSENGREGLVLSLGGRLGRLGRVRRSDRGAAGQPPIVGFAGFWHVFDEAHITTIGIDPGLRGRALGELMLVALIEEALGRGAGYLSLEVRVSNHVAMRLYEKYGFQIKGTRPRYYVDDGEDAYVMWSPPIRTESFRALLDARRETLQTRIGADTPLPARGGSGRVAAPVAGASQ